jgi:hypothetical protein
MSAQGAVETLLLSAASDDESPRKVGQGAPAAGDVKGHSINITPRMTLSSYVLYDGTEMCKLQIRGGWMDNLERSRELLAEGEQQLKLLTEGAPAAVRATWAASATAHFTASIAYGQQAALDAARAMSAQEVAPDA